MTEDEELESSALKIQKIARGRKARRGNRRVSSPKKALASEEDMAAAKLQSLQRGKKSRKRVEEMRDQKAAAGRIQAIHRGRADRRVVLAKKEGGLELEVKDIRKGLSQMARNPFTLRHSYVKLDLNNQAVKTIDAISQFTNLQFVEMNNNCIADLSPLALLPSLLTLDASNNNLTECLDYVVPECNESNMFADGVTAIGSMLHEANLSCNKIEKIRDLSPHRFLHHLDLSSNNIKTIEGLSSLSMLQTLSLANNQISKIQGLDNLPLISLDLGNNKLKTIANLDTLPRLEKLFLNNNEIESLAALRGCHTLRELDIGTNAVSIIRQVEFLVNISKLAKLTLMNNPCDGLEFYRLRVITRLTGLAFLDGNAVSAEEKVKAINLYGGEGSDLANRKAVWVKCFPEKEFPDFLPPFQEVEEDVVAAEEKKADAPTKGDFRGMFADTGAFVEGIMSTALQRAITPTTIKMGATL